MLKILLMTRVELNWNPPNSVAAFMRMVSTFSIIHVSGLSTSFMTESFCCSQECNRNSEHRLWNDCWPEILTRLLQTSLHPPVGADEVSGDSVMSASQSWWPDTLWVILIWFCWNLCNIISKNVLLWSFLCNPIDLLTMRLTAELNHVDCKHVMRCLWF